MSIQAFDLGNGKYKFTLPKGNDYVRIDGRYAFVDSPRTMSDIMEGKIQLQDAVK